MTPLKELPIERSKALLLENLNESQRVEFLRNEQFTVEADGQKYNLKKDITVKSDGTRLCAISPGLPVYDQMLARKLALENAPDLFLSVANNLSAAPSNLYGRGRLDTAIDFVVELIKRTFESRGFDTDKMRVDVSRSAEHYQMQITVRYGQYAAAELVDPNHFSYANIWTAIEPVIEHMAHDLSRLIIKRAGEQNA